MIILTDPHKLVLTLFTASYLGIAIIQTSIYMYLCISVLLSHGDRPGQVYSYGAGPGCGDGETLTTATSGTQEK